MKLSRTMFAVLAQRRGEEFARETLALVTVDGEWLNFTEQTAAIWRAKYWPARSVEEDQPGLAGSERGNPRRILGLGDWVEAWAKPVAKAVDAVSARLGRPTKVAGCSACSRRRHVLNRVLPDLGSVAVWRSAPKRAWVTLKAVLRAHRKPAKRRG